MMRRGRPHLFRPPPTLHWPDAVSTPVRPGLSGFWGDTMGIFDSLFRPNVAGLKQKKDHDGLWKLREHKDWNVRREALVALAQLGDERGVKYLLAATQPGDTELGTALVQAVSKDPKLAAATVRIAQAGGYGYASERVFLVLDTYHTRIPPEIVVDDLVESREGPLWWSRGDLKRMLQPFGHRVVTHLIELMEDLHKARKAIPLIGALGRSAGAAAKPLIEAFKLNPALQSEIQPALLELYDTALDALLAALDNPDERVRALAAKILAKLPNYVRQRQGDASLSVAEEKAIRERLNESCARGVAKAKADSSDLVRSAAKA